MESIKTNYNGQEFKSRLEANMAFILDEMEYDWEYEPESFLLDNGEHYQPDFYIPTLNLWIETRGYSTTKGDKQIDGFWKKIKNLEDLIGEEYLVIASDGCKFYDNLWTDGNIPASIAKCENCGKYFFYSEQGSFVCRNCDYYDGDHHLHRRKNLMVGKDSEIYVGGVSNYTKLKEWIKEVK